MLGRSVPDVVFGRILVVARNPAQLVLAAFVALIAVGTVLLRLPFSVDGGVDHPGWIDSLFWATSAATVTGLGTVDVSTFSLFGELVLLALIQIGGFGIMTIGSVAAIVASRRVGLRQRMLAQAEIGAIDMGELRYLIAAIAKITVAVELSIAVILFAHLVTVDELGNGQAAYSSIFHGISAFNNAGISLYSDSLSRFVRRPVRRLPDHGRVRDRRPRVPDPGRVATTGPATPVEPAHPHHPGGDGRPARRRPARACSSRSGPTRAPSGS